MTMNVHVARSHATMAGSLSSCAKSKRGAVIFSPYHEHVIAAGYNSPPDGFLCDGSDACRASCGKVAVHAEQAALLNCITLRRPSADMEMLHTKVERVGGEWVSVRGGPPSCAACSKLIVAANISHMWLIEDRDGVATPVRYTAAEFHQLTLANCGLHSGMVLPRSGGAI